MNKKICKELRECAQIIMDGEYKSKYAQDRRSRVVYRTGWAGLYKRLKKSWRKGYRGQALIDYAMHYQPKNI